MMNKSTVNASSVNVIEKMEKQDIKVLVFVNVVFSFSDAEESTSNSSKPQSSNGIQCSIADCVNVRPYYHSNISICENPDKSYAYECNINCGDLYSDEEGTCIDPLGMYSKILDACYQIDDYFGKLFFENGTDVQVCINILGFEQLWDVVWGFAFLADACCQFNVEDSDLDELIMDEYEPFFLSYLEKGWKVNVVFIAFLEYYILYEIYNENERNRKAVDPNKVLSAKISKDETIVKENLPDDNGDSDENTPLLEGRVEKNEIILSSFFTLNHFLDCVLPFGAIRLLDKVTGTDKIAEDIEDKIIRASVAFVKGDTDEGWDNLKQAGASSLDYTHKRLDIIGFAPGVGTVAGVADGLLYTVQEGYAAWNGDIDKAKELRTEALWAYAGAIPFAKVVKYGKTVAKSRKVIDSGMKAIQNAEEAHAKADKLRKAAKATLNKSKNKKKRKINNKKNAEAKKKEREARAELEKARNNEAYLEELNKYGVKYKDAMQKFKWSIRRDFNAIDSIYDSSVDFKQNLYLHIIKSTVNNPAY